MKYLLEFEDLSNLLGDLEDIGLAKKVQVVISMEIPNMIKHDRSGWETVFVFPAKTEAFWSAGDPKQDLEKSLKQIAAGNFEFVYPPYKQVKNLEAGSPGLWKFLNRESIQRMAGEGWKDFEAFANALQAESTRLNREASGFHPSVAMVKLQVFITPPGLLDEPGGLSNPAHNATRIPSDHPEVVSFYTKDSL